VNILHNCLAQIAAEHNILRLSFDDSARDLARTGVPGELPLLREWLGAGPAPEFGVDNKGFVVEIYKLKFLVIVKAFLILHFIFIKLKTSAIELQCLQIRRRITITLQTLLELVPLVLGFACFRHLLRQHQQDAGELVLDFCDLLLLLEQLVLLLLYFSGQLGVALADSLHLFLY